MHYRRFFFPASVFLPSLRDFCSLPLLQDCYFYYIITVQQWLKDHAIWLYLQSPTQPSPPKSTPFTCNISLVFLSSPFPFFMVPASPHLSGTITLSPSVGKVKIQLAHTSCSRNWGGNAQGWGGSIYSQAFLLVFGFLFYVFSLTA